MTLLPQKYSRTGLFFTLLSQGKLKELEQFTDSVCVLYDDCETLQFYVKFYDQYIKREYDQADKYYNQFVNAGGSTNVWDRVNIAFVYKKLGKENEAKAIIDKILSTSQGSKFYRSFWIHALLDEREEAMMYLSKALEGAAEWGYDDFLLIDPLFENLRDDPEFATIVKRAKDKKAAIRSQIREMEKRGELDL